MNIRYPIYEGVYRILTPDTTFEVSPNTQCKVNRQVTSKYNLPGSFTFTLLKLAISERW